MLKHIRAVLVMLGTVIVLLPADLAIAGDVLRRIALEMDPLAPAAAARETQKGNPTSMWGFNADFNLGGISTGPEVWIGTFRRKGNTDCTLNSRVDDFQCGEAFKGEATRIRWMATLWEMPESIRGWYVKAGYSYTKIVAKIRRNTEFGIKSRFDASAGEMETDVTDMRQGVVVGFGERWALWNQKATLTVGASYTANFGRNVSTDGDDPLAKSDYNEIIEDIQDTRMYARPMPELNIAFGYLM